jgi:hypothetical protein
MGQKKPFLGVAPRGVSLRFHAHHDEQNGDLMRDPEMRFEPSGYPLTATIPRDVLPVVDASKQYHRPCKALGYASG